MKTATQQWYEDHILGPANQANAAVREQIAIAMDSIPSKAEDVDAWFNKHLRQPPVSYDTELYNTLQAAKKELKAALKAPAEPKGVADEKIEKPEKTR